MLEINHVYKEYRTGSLIQKALDGVSISFRETEFVAILGPSGSGKTTLLNVIGGLDRYDSGEMTIRGVPTSRYGHRDWDTYRNHTIGFIFQSYNLIPHQTILSNVEIAMTLAGVGREERIRRAKEALDRVGLLEQAQKKPMQLSGGQMQRVAIARALVNRPSVLLADEPTGALDSDTGEQVMKLLKEVADDHLVVMVTHNPELAAKYATRIVRLKDGKITDDSAPYIPGQTVPAGAGDVKEAPEYSRQEERPSASTGKEPSQPVEERFPDGGTGQNETGQADRTVKTAQSSRSLAESMISATPMAYPVKSESSVPKTEPPLPARQGREHMRKPSMSLFTAFSLSVSNLLSKKARTILVAFAASIGIVGIALILSLSNGANSYIRRMERDSLSQYPIEITSSSFSMEETMMGLAAMRQSAGESSGNQVTEQQLMGGMLSFASINDLASLKRWFESGYSGMEEYTRGIDYNYGISPQIYRLQDDGYRQVNPDQTMSAFGLSMDESLSGAMSGYNMVDVFYPLPENDALYMDDYELMAGNWPQKDTDLVLVLTGSGNIPDFLLYTMGLKDSDELNTQIQNVIAGEGSGVSKEGLEDNQVYDPESFIGISFRLLPAYETFTYDENMEVWLDHSADEEWMRQHLENAEELKIVGVVRPTEGVNFGLLGIGLDYPPAMLKRLIAQAAESPLVQDQMEREEINILTGIPFGESEGDSMKSLISMMEIHPEYLEEAVTVKWDSLGKLESDDTRLTTQRMVRIVRELTRTGKSSTLEEMMKSYLPLLGEVVEIDEEKMANVINFAMDEKQMQEMFAARAASQSTNYNGNMLRFGYTDPDVPSRVTIYPVDFDSKSEVTRLLDAYNAAVKEEGHEEKVITYTDYVGALMSSVTTIIDVITYVLIAFVAVSLVVSSIMIGIITYISVLERRKEIGILRAMGASRRNITEVFNAETFVIGLLAGAFGIGLTLLLTIPINHIIRTLANQDGIRAFLPPGAGVILVILCVFLTFLGGFIPSRKAARQDPVAALRSE